MKALLALLALALLTIACGHNSATAPTRLVLTGSSTVAPLISEIAKRYERAHPGVLIDVQTGGSSRGAADTRRALADIGMVSRALKPEESDLMAHTIARDGICVIVNSANPLTTLTRDQVIAIYTGKIDNWRELGGPNLGITVVNKAEGRSTLELFLSYFGLANEEIKADVVIGDNAQGIKTIIGNPGAIGYVSIGAAEYEAKAGGALRLLPMEGVLANQANVANQSYPLARPLNLVTKNAPAGVIADFIGYAASAEVKDIIESQYFVPEKP